MRKRSEIMERYIRLLKRRASLIGKGRFTQKEMNDLNATIADLVWVLDLSRMQEMKIFEKENIWSEKG